MATMSLFSKGDDLPGVHGIVRDCTREGKGWRKITAGDIAVIDAPDISRVDAQRLLAVQPSVVVNSSAFSTGMMPNVGPQMLLDANIVLVENVGTETRFALKNGKPARLTDEGELYHGSTLIGKGHVLTREEAESSFVEARRNLVENMEAYFGNATEFINSESPLLIDGIGIPDVDVPIRGRSVVVVAPGREHYDELAVLRSFIREWEPVLIGVDSAADTLVEAGYHPALIVGNPTTIGAQALRSGARLILPAEPDGFAAGLERVQDLGIGAVTFPAATDSATDLALLLASYHGASLVVLAGAEVDLTAMFSGAEVASPSALLTRVKLGSTLVDARTVAELRSADYSGRSTAWLWALLGCVVLVSVVLLIAGLDGPGSFGDNLIDTWNNIALTVQGWWK